LSWNSSTKPLLDRLSRTQATQLFIPPKFPRGFLEGGAIKAWPLLPQSLRRHATHVISTKLSAVLSIGNTVCPYSTQSKWQTFEEFGSPCVCGAENFERVVVERVPSRPVVTDLIACVECRCVYYAPLPKGTAARSSGPPMPSGVVGNEPGLLKSWGGVSSGHPLSRQTPQELQAIEQAAARANKSKKRRR
jgi:hypothetical protein